jgi:hypothetical protein
MRINKNILVSKFLIILEMSKSKRLINDVSSSSDDSDIGEVLIGNEEELDDHEKHLENLVFGIN